MHFIPVHHLLILSINIFPKEQVMPGFLREENCVGWVFLRYHKEATFTWKILSVYAVKQ